MMSAAGRSDSTAAMPSPRTARPRHEPSPYRHWFIQKPYVASEPLALRHALFFDMIEITDLDHYLHVHRTDSHGNAETVREC